MAFNDSSTRKETSGAGSDSYTTRSSSNSKGKKSTWMITALTWVITGIIGAFIFANIKPYEVIATNFLSGISYETVGNVLTSIPFLGGVLKLVFGLFHFSLGVLFWAFIQMLELLPLVLFGHGAFLDNTIQRSGGKRYGTRENDEWEVKVAKTIGNSLNTEVLRFLILLGIGVYVADFFLCLSIFPPTKNHANFFNVLQTGQYKLIDWGNILKAIATVGAVEVLVKLRVILVQIAKDLKD